MDLEEFYTKEELEEMFRPMAEQILRYKERLILELLKKEQESREGSGESE